jgi:hypothetical protein
VDDPDRYWPALIEFATFERVDAGDP